MGSQRTVQHAERNAWVKNPPYGYGFFFAFFDGSRRHGKDSQPRKDTMKRLSPDRRKQLTHDHIRRLAADWTCRYGQWNCEKLLLELESALRARRHRKKAAASGRTDRT